MVPRHHSSGSCSDHSGLGWLIVMGVLQLFTTEPASLMSRAFAAVVEMSIPRSSMLVPLTRSTGRAAGNLTSRAAICCKWVSCTYVDQEIGSASQPAPQKDTEDELQIAAADSGMSCPATAAAILCLRSFTATGAARGFSPSDAPSTSHSPSSVSSQ